MLGFRRTRAAARAPLDDVLERMRPLPYDSQTRWAITEEVTGRASRRPKRRR